MYRFRFAYAFPIGLLLALGSCSKPEHLADEHYYLVASNIKLPYWQTVAAGFQQAGRALGVTTKVVGPETYDVAGEVQEFRKAVQSKPAGILVSAADAAQLKPEIDRAIDSGVPVVTIDSDVPGSKRLLFIGTNNYEAGRMGGKALLERVKKGTVMVFTMPSQPNLGDRLKGYREVLSDSPQIKLEIVNIEGNARVAFDRVSEVLTKQPNSVDAFVCLEASSGKEVAEVVARNKSDKPIIAMDTDEETLQAVQKGTIVATISQKPYTMAYYGLRLLADLHNHPLKKLDGDWRQDSFAVLPAFIDTGASLINKGNVDSFLKDRQNATAGAQP